MNDMCDELTGYYCGPPKYRSKDYYEGYNEALKDVTKKLLDNTKPTEKYIDSEVIVKVIIELEKK